MRSKILATIGIFFLFLFILFIGVLALTQTELFRNGIRKLAEKAVSSATNQGFTIGSIEGNLFNGFKVKDVRLSIENEPFVYVAELSVGYSLPVILDRFMSFSKVIPVKDLGISGLDVKLIKYQEGRWNFQKLVPEDKKAVGKEDVKKIDLRPKWSIILSNFILKNSEIKIDDRGKGKVSEIKISELELALKLLGITKRIELNLKKANVSAVKPDIALSDLSVQALYSKEKASLKNLRGKINGAKVNFDGEVLNLKQPEFKFQASAHGYNFNSIGVLNAEIEGSGKYISPEDIKAEISLEVPESEFFGRAFRFSTGKIKIAGTKITLNNANLKTKFGVAEFRGNADLRGLLTKQGKNDFDLECSLHDVNTSEVLAILDQKIKKWPDILNNNLVAALNARLDIKGYWKEVEDFKILAAGENMSLSGPSLGEITTTGTVEVTRPSVNLDLVSSLKNVDLASALKQEKLRSSITASFKTRQSIPIKGDFSDNYAASVEGKILPSLFSGLSISDGRIDASYKKNALDLQSLSLNSDSFTFKTKPSSLKGEGLDLGYELQVNDLNVLSKFLPHTEAKGQLRAAGKVHGEIRKPTVTISASLSDFEFDDYFEAMSTKINGAVTLDFSDMNLDLKVNAEKTSIKNHDFERVDLIVKGKGKQISSEVSILEDGSRNYKVELNLQDPISQEKKIEISKLELNLHNRVLTNRKPMLITIAPDKLIVDEFNIHYNSSSVTANGIYGFDGLINSDLNLSNLNLDEISDILQLEPPLKGIVSADISLKGSVDTPNIAASISAQNLIYSNFKSDITNLGINYLDRRLELAFDIMDEKRAIFSANGTIDTDLSLKSIGPDLKRGNLNLNIHSEGVDLSPLAALIEEIKEISGILITDLSLKGGAERPSINGQFKLQDLKIRLHSLRNTFQIPDLLLDFQGKKGFLRSAEISSDGGKGTFSGEIDLEAIAYTIDGAFEDLLIKPKAVSAIVNGDIKLRGANEQISIEGKLKIPRARINIPDEPKKKLPEIKFVDVDEEEEFLISDTKETDFFKEHVAMDIKASIPRNAWVKGRGANIEIKGNFDIKKKYGGPIRLFGTANTVRGSYKILGKLFTIQRGTVSFRGQEEINPLLDIQALYEVSKVDAFINIGGTAKKPEIRFSSDPPMQESDILSYIVFGTSTNKIGSGERNSLEGIAAGIAGGIAVNQLKDVLGDDLSPDVLRIGTSQGVTEIEVGKYLTDNLYVSYKRGSSDSALGTSTLTTDWVFIEYEIFDFLTLDSQIGGENPGADIFYNFSY